ncbi:hypothetical protein ON010_g5997 [Phytophthora cinnamomi]|nr:hypothetical protein ON010_g5997 [Phytophthora cinnamomi]
MATKRTMKAVLRAQSSTCLKTRRRKRPGPSARAPASRSPSPSHPSKARSQSGRRSRLSDRLYLDFGHQLSLGRVSHTADFGSSSGPSGGRPSSLEETALGRPAPDDGRPGVSGRVGLGRTGQVSPHEVAPLRPRRHATVNDVLSSTGCYTVDQVYSASVLDCRLDISGNPGQEWRTPSGMESTSKPPPIRSRARDSGAQRGRRQRRGIRPTRTSKRRRLSTSSAEPRTPKKSKSKKSKKPRSEVQLGSESESHAEIKSKSKDSSEVRPQSKSKCSKLVIPGFRRISLPRAQTT